MENVIIKLLADILDTHVLSPELTERCSNVLIGMIKDTPLTVQEPANSNNPVVLDLNKDSMLISPVPKGEYEAKLLDSTVSRNRTNVPVLKLTFMVSEGEWKDNPVYKLMTLNQYGMRDLIKYLEKLSPSKQEYASNINAIQSSGGDMEKINALLKQYIGISHKISWTPKDGYKGFNKLNILS